ncbi:hypothetical protein FKM82_005096 [Ascaphus truei]
MHTRVLTTFRIHLQCLNIQHWVQLVSQLRVRGLNPLKKQNSKRYKGWQTSVCVYRWRKHFVSIDGGSVWCL